MENQACVRCGKRADNKLPLCISCRESLADFNALVEYLNSFTGSKEDLFWIIVSEIYDRESCVINDCNIEIDYANGVMNLVPVAPSSSTVKMKPWLKAKYQRIKSTIDEISKLRRALGIAKQYYGVA